VFAWLVWAERVDLRTLLGPRTPRRRDLLIGVGLVLAVVGSSLHHPPSTGRGQRGHQPEQGARTRSTRSLACGKSAAMVIAFSIGGD
jgi:hypothetical protein